MGQNRQALHDLTLSWRSLSKRCMDCSSKTEARASCSALRTWVAPSRMAAANCSGLKRATRAARPSSTGPSSTSARVSCPTGGAGGCGEAAPAEVDA